MNVQQWLRNENTIKRSKKSYAHFDYRTDIGSCSDYITDPDKVSKHGFYPFIHYEIKMVKFSKEKGKKPPKIRDICYASHIDRCIYQYYNYILNAKYNERIRNDGIASVPVAYRTDLHQNNIHFAKRAFDFIRESKSCYIMIGDFTGFFDNLDHGYLKKQWCSLIGKECLPKDHYAVFKNITRYSKWELTDLLKLNGLSDTAASRKELNNKSLVISHEQFKANRDMIVKNPNSYGIPQGSPNSALLTNVYMLDVDKKVYEIVATQNGIYMRYSDDFIIILPNIEKDAADECLSGIVELINKTDGLTLQNEKTQFFYFDGTTIANCSADFHTNADCKNRYVNFLGFTFDGKDVVIRPKTVTKYYYRMHRKVKGIVSAGGISPRGRKISKRNLYEKYSVRGAYGKKGNFLSYVARSKAIFGEESIERDTRNHMQKIKRALKGKQIIK